MKYNTFSLQLGSESLLCIYTGVSWGDATLAKQVESTRARLTPIKSYIAPTQLVAASFGSNSSEVMESIKCHWCRQGAPETQGVILAKSKIKIYKHDNVVEQPGNTMNTILLDVIFESIQICDLSFCVDSLNHMYFRAVWGLSTDSFPAWKQLVDKNNGDAGRKIHVGECCWRFATQIWSFKIGKIS